MSIARIFKSVCIFDNHLAGIRPRAHSCSTLDRDATSECSRNAKDMPERSKV